MFGTTVDVAIGLILTYLLFALLIATVVEMVAGIFRLRARALENAIIGMIDDPPAESLSMAQKILAAIFGNFRMFFKTRMMLTAHRAAPQQKDILAAATLKYEDVFHHPLVGGRLGKPGPSYITPQNFSSAILFALRGAATGSVFSSIERSIDALPAGQLRIVLVTLVNEAQGDLDALRSGIERWYDMTMDRLSGDYKRYAQVITLLMGFGLAAACNVDSINIIRRLSAEPALRTALAEQATEYVNNHKSDPQGDAQASGTQDLNARIKAVGDAQSLLLTTAPVGWNNYTFTVLSPLGWLVSAIAAMLGSPFWFDMLQKVVSLRNTGPKPAASAQT